MLQFWALTSKGVEEVLASELTSLGATVSKVSLGAVRFEATLEQGYQICLWSRLATRIMRQLDQISIDEK